MNKPKHVINRLQNYTQDACAFNDINSIIKLIISQMVYLLINKCHGMPTYTDVQLKNTHI